MKQRRQRRLMSQMPTLHEALDRYLREVSVKKNHMSKRGHWLSFGNNAQTWPSDLLHQFGNKI